ncbi:hydrogen peroxide-inducible genes activator [Sphingomonas radiodurans]|uniref:hydrogen peroxide-inducible genes activator n=1 Tax=Sphingomonas radiodurans TaxID=2890321 RepID=UPI001E2C6559|nr:hydrogen peroxide-inducible genes activator [Sphingomonas radiodurans]WBH18033.1 hydrogen peroxide-inducible genes activator [Sphingomonas radiodurans]
MKPIPSLRQLSYLLALHEHGHFGRAAAACFVSQSTLSVGIAELERLLGTSLVERSKRHVRFTLIGEEIVVRARQTVRAAEDLHTVAQRSHEPLVGALRMAMIPTIAPFLLSSILLALARDWPLLQLHVREMLTSVACEAMGRGEVDCVLLALPVECGEVETVDIAVDRLSLVAAKGEDELALPLCDADAKRLLLLEDGHCLKDHALAACNRATAVSESRLIASTLHTLVQLVDAGLGYTLLPQMAIDAGILVGTRVEARPVQGLHASRHIALAWRKGHPRSSDFALLGEAIKRAVGTDAV